MTRRLALVLLLALLAGHPIAAQVPEVTWETLVEGTGSPVAMGDTVAVKYKLTLPDGKLIDSTPEDGDYKLEIGSTKMIPGISLGVVGMKRGESRRITVPPHYGYGPVAMGEIPAESTLIFEVQLLYRLAEAPPDRAHQPEAGHEEAAPGDTGQGGAGHAHAHDDDSSTDGLGGDGSSNRPHAHSTEGPAIMEYLTRDFYTRPWRYDDAPKALWKSSLWLTLLAVGLAVVLRVRAGGVR